jgi:hypothetical protein
VTGDVQPTDPPAELLRVARDVSAAWMRRSLAAAIVSAGDDPDRWQADIERVASSEADALLVAVAELLATDVDEQRTTPLSLFRRSNVGLTSWLHSIGVPPPRPDAVARAGPADDPYQLGPVTWSDIDPVLHEPGLAWGAWKAMEVLGRRRDEGRR